jgi:hypothetical protein
MEGSMNRKMASDRLQEVLRYWQDLCWTYERSLQSINVDISNPMVPAHVRNWRTLEHQIFDNNISELRASDWLMDREMCSIIKNLATLNMFPFQFFNWSRKSRRVYHLPGDLHRLFAVATYPKIKWEDVLLPFESFMITLEEPFRVEDEPDVWCEYDAILVSRLPEGLFSVRLMRQPHVNNEEQRYPEKTKRRVDLLLKRGDKKRANQLINRTTEKWMHTIRSSPGWRAAAIPTEPQKRVLLEPLDLATSVYVRDFSELEGGVESNLWRLEPLSWALKIAVGWCLYLRSMSAKELSWEEVPQRPHKAGHRGLTGVITETDHICTILGYGKMDPSRYGLTEASNKVGSSFFVRPHWRRAHDRRPPGSPPTAPKSVTLPPLLIRKDLVPLFGIIGGTKTEVLPED